MGTFHPGAGELHGITVVVETTGTRVVIGRCQEYGDEGILLHDADVHDEGPGGPTKSDFIARAARFGVWSRHPRLMVPRTEIAAVTRLGDYARG